MTNEQSSLEREIEETRDRLASTIDTLVHRASPKTIIDRQVTAVRAYFTEPDGSPRTDNIVKVAGGVIGVIALFVIIRKVGG